MLVYKVGKRGVLNCSGCVREGKDENPRLRARSISKAELQRTSTTKITQKNPTYCANCCWPIWK